MEGVSLFLDFIYLSFHLVIRLWEKYGKADLRQKNVGKYNIYFRRERVSIKIPLEKNMQVRRKIVIKKNYIQDNKEKVT